MSYSQWMAVFSYAFEHLGTVLGKNPFPQRIGIWDTKAELAITKSCFYKHVFFFSSD